ncbi:MAG: carboxypeptidase regulatory-like domain-containing protein [Blastocatellia bacterium]|nr:carboxypeptidase regulatory-like domain-containing protein [Blastocatellia bacterium]
MFWKLIYPISKGLSLPLKYLLIAAIFSTASFALAEKGSIKGKVVNESGKGIATAQVTAQNSQGAEFQVKTNSKGEFQLSDLEPGEYSISVDAEGYKSVELLNKQKVESGKTTKISSEIELPISTDDSLLRGVVFTERGYSVQGATVEIEKKVDSSSKGKSFKKQYVTNQAGEFAFRLPGSGGQYQLKVTARGFETATQTIDLVSGESRSIAFSLKNSSK